MALRNLSVLLLLAYFSLFAQTADELLIFAEVGSGLYIAKQFNENSETNISTIISSELQTPVSRLAFDGSINSLTNLDSITSWQTGIIYERVISQLNFSISGRYLDDEDNYLDVKHFAVQLFEQNESSTDFNEYGLWGKSSSFPQNESFSNQEFNLYFLTKRFLETYTVHHEFNLATKHFTDIAPLLLVNYKIAFSYPAGDYSGLNLTYFFNYNLFKESQQLYPSDREKLFDLFSYNMHKFSIEYTLEKNNLLFKPGLALTSKDYLSIAVRRPDTETSFLTNLYADWLWADGCMLYTEGFYQTILSNNKIAYEFTTGIKFQFDLLAR